MKWPDLKLCNLYRCIECKTAVLAPMRPRRCQCCGAAGVSLQNLDLIESPQPIDSKARSAGEASR